MDDRSFTDVGGTPGGIRHFLLGFIMACIGGYLLCNQVMVMGSYWSFYGANTFGVTLLPMLFGIGILFWNGRSAIGWLLTAAGGAVHRRGRDRQPASLLPAGEPFRDAGDAHTAGGRPRADRPIHARARRMTCYHF